MGSSVLEHRECVSTGFELRAERNLPKAIRNSLGEKVGYQPDGN